VLEFIASKISTNIRELEGALIRVTAFASLKPQGVDLALAEIVLKDLIPDSSQPRSPRRRSWRRPRPTSASPWRSSAARRARACSSTPGRSRCTLCRELTDLSLPKIGQQFGGRDHTTVMHADKKIRQLMAERRSVYNQVTELTNRIKSQARAG
jgi:chromosomal replication initiator protein